MAVSPNEGESITVHGDAIAPRTSSGRIRKPSAKIRVIEQTIDRKDHAELKNEIKELSMLLIQELILRRDAEKEQMLKDCSKKIEALEKELQEEKKRSKSLLPGLDKYIYAPRAECAEITSNPRVQSLTASQDH